MMQTENLIVPDSCCSGQTHVCSEKQSCSEMTELENESHLLESRLDEQTNLIMIIKTRAQETDVKWKALEDDNRRLTHMRDNSEKKLEEQGKNLAEMTDILKTLQEEYDELLAVVSDLQYNKEQLVKEKSRLVKENDNILMLAKSEAKKQIAALTQTRIELENECLKVNQKISTETKEMERKKHQYRNSIASIKFSHKEEIRELMDNLHLKKFAYQETDRALKKEEEAYINGLPIPEDVMKLEVRHKSLTQEDNTIHRELLIEQLKTNDIRKLISGLGEKVHEMNTLFDQKAAEVEAISPVQELYKKIKEANEQYLQLRKDIQEFKKESQIKLQVEREINQKLRHIH